MDFWIENDLTTVTAGTLLGQCIKFCETQEHFEERMGVCTLLKLVNSETFHFSSPPHPKIEFYPQSSSPRVVTLYDVLKFVCIFWKRKFHIVKRRNAADVVQLKWFSLV